MTSDTASSRIGVILHERRGETEELLTRFVLRLQAAGVEVGGLVQRTTKEPNGKNRMEVVDVRTGAAYRISQNLGPGSDSCCVDSAGLAEASVVLRREIEQRPALLVVSKFSGLETEGGGLLHELFEAIARDIPVLTALTLRHKPQWDAFTDGAGTMLPPDEEALWAWWNGLRRGTDTGAWGTGA